MQNIQFFILIVFISGIRIAEAQRFQGGLKTGLVGSEVSGDNLSGPTKPGFYASAFTFLPISDFSLLQLEVMFIQKGSRAIPSERNNFNEYRLSLDYVEVPLLFKTNIKPYTELNYLEKLWLHAGFSFSSVVNHFEQDEFGANVSNLRDSDFNPAEINILLGFSYPIFSGFDFVFGFSNSLTPLRPHAGGAKRWYNRGQYNTLWSFGISYVFW